MNIALLVANFYPEMAATMVDAAQQRVKKNGATVIHIIEVPGCYDMPVLMKALAQREDVDAIVALGTVIEGETGHDLIVAENVARKAADISVEFMKPITMGVSGPRMTREQAEARKIVFPERAVDAALALHKHLEALRDT